MSANIFGEKFKVLTFGESHGVALGAVLDGVPAGIQFDSELVAKNLIRRRPGMTQMSKNIVSSRNEEDQFEVLSGVFEGKTLGTPIAMIVRNNDHRSADYEGIKNSARIGHADDVWLSKFQHVDYRGGGRSSGRETLSRVLAGSVAEMFFKQKYPNINVKAFALQIGPHKLEPDELAKIENLNIDDYYCRFPSSKSLNVYEDLIRIQSLGESYGGVVQLIITQPPQNLGQPVFHKLKNDLASAMLSIGAVNGFEFGAGFSESDLVGSQYHADSKSIRYGGIRGGISTGETIQFRLSFKPTASINEVAKKGRHDPCILIRAIPVIESMTWLTLLDHVLWSKTDSV